MSVKELDKCVWRKKLFAFTKPTHFPPRLKSCAKNWPFQNAPSDRHLVFAPRPPASCTNQAFPANRNNVSAARNMSKTQPSWRGRTVGGSCSIARLKCALTHLPFFKITDFLFQDIQDSFGSVVVLHLRWDLHGRLRWSTWHNSH